MVRSCSIALASRALAMICSAAVIASCCLRSDRCAALSRASSIILPVRIGLRDDFLVTLLRFSEFLFDFLRIKLAFLDLAPALPEHSKDRLVSEALQKECNNAEANDLR